MFAIFGKSGDGDVQAKLVYHLFYGAHLPFSTVGDKKVGQGCFLFYSALMEDEVNGLFTYDRAAIKPDPAAVRAVNQALEAAFEKTVE